MSKKEQPEPLRFVRHVTPEHGEVFVDEWRLQSDRCGLMCDAFAQTEIMEYPDLDDPATAPQRRRYESIEDEILERTFAAVRDVIAKQFVKAANDVLSRERELRQRKRRG
ncbi:MAG TPA: hypothetical protein VE974_19885 [Thermoanaerobaculia bacterium]|nr:hypothetical protein [Thermoanaerobaculia bacterium]